MNDRELMFTPAHEQRRMMLDGEISSIELTEACFRRIEALDSATQRLHHAGSRRRVGHCRRTGSPDREWKRTRGVAWCADMRQGPRSKLTA